MKKFNSFNSVPDKLSESSFSLNDNVSVRFNKHTNPSLTIVRQKPQKERKQMKSYQDKINHSIQRKVERLKKRFYGEGKDPKKDFSLQKHEYEYKQFGDEPKIDFSGFSLVIIAPVLLSINLSIGQAQQISMVQYLFVTSFVSFLFNFVVIMRANRLMPFLPDKQKDNRLKWTCVWTVIGMIFCLNFGWNASGGMIFAILWQYLRGNQGCFYFIIFGVTIAGSMTLENVSNAFQLLQYIPSIIFGYVCTEISTFKLNSTYAIANQMSLFIMVTTVGLYPFFQIQSTSFRQYVILCIFGFSVYFNILIIIKLMQTQRVSIVMSIMSGILIISTTKFVGVADYVGFLTITLSILVLLKMEFLDK